MFGAAWLEPMVEDGVWEKSWPLYPLAEANGVFFILSRSYVLAGGAEDPIDYLRYCRANGMFRRTLLLTPSTPQARQALLLLLDRIRTFSRVEIPAEHLEYLQKQTEKRANQASEPTPPSVTDRADARSAPAGVVAHL
jgi:hypothetical protein